MIIYFKGSYSILGQIFSDSKEQKFRFEVPISGIRTITLDIIPSERIVEAFCDYDVSEESWKALQAAAFDKEKLAPQLRAEFSAIESGLSEATRKTLNLIKYNLNQRHLQDTLFASEGVYCSIDRTEWKRLPRALSVAVNVQIFPHLNENTAGVIQEYLKEGLEPFFSLRHLHRAIEESNPRYKWIDATIAAELAIKEFLIRLNPELEALVVEVPSPPLDKLYGPILKSYAGTPSPKLKEIREGAHTRNKLIHRPQDTHIDHKKAIKYVNDIEIAIYHLLTLLYPNDAAMKYLLHPAMMKQE